VTVCLSRAESAHLWLVAMCNFCVHPDVAAQVSPVFGRRTMKTGERNAPEVRNPNAG